MKIQYKYLFPIYLFLEMKLHCLVISKQNYNVLSPNFHIHVSVRDLYISMIGLPRTDRGNKKSGMMPRSLVLGIYVWNFRYSVLKEVVGSLRGGGRFFVQLFRE